MKKIGPLIKIALLTLLAVVISLLIVFTISKKIETGAKEIFQKRSILTLLEKRGENFLSLKNSHEIIREKLPLLKNILPNEENEENIEKLIIDLENLSIKTNNEQDLNFNPIETAEKEGTVIRALKFSATLTGNIDSFAQYMNELQKLPYFFEIYNVSIKNSQGISNNKSVMSMDIIVYIR